MKNKQTPCSGYSRLHLVSGTLGSGPSQLEQRLSVGYKLYQTGHLWWVTINNTKRKNCTRFLPDPSTQQMNHSFMSIISRQPSMYLAYCIIVDYWCTYV